MKRQLLTLLAALATLSLIGCGSSSSNNGLSSLQNPGFGGGLPFPGSPGVQQSQAHCNGFNGDGFLGRVQVFKMNGQSYSGTQQLRFDQVPADFDEQNTIIRFSGWKPDSSTAETLSFYIEDRQTQNPISGMIESISVDDLVEFAKVNLGRNMTAKEMMRRINFVIIEASSSKWKGLRIAYYQRGSHQGDINMLLPEFPIDTTQFSQTFPDYMVALHPGPNANSFCF